MDEAYKLSDGYRNWAAFVEEFRTIEESLQESKQVERMLIGRCNQLKSELVASAKKLHTVMSVRAEDERTMALLRKECDRSVVTSMDAQLKEKQAMALVSGLQADIEALQTQVGVLQSALWLERERANAAVNASRSIGKNTSKSALLRLNTTSPASVAAAEAAAAAAGALAASSTGIGGGSGSPAARKHGFRAKRTGGGLGGRAIRLASSHRPATAATTATAQGRHKARGRLQAGVGTGLYGESSSEFWGGGGGGGQAGNNEIEARDFEAGVFEAGGNSMSGTVLTDASLGLGGWKTHGIDTFFHGRGRVGRGGGHLGPGQEAATGGYVLDLDGRRGYAHAGGGGPAGEEGSGGGGEAITPFQRWKKSRGIVSPGVAEVFAGQGCFL